MINKTKESSRKEQSEAEEDERRKMPNMIQVIKVRQKQVDYKQGLDTTVRRRYEMG